MSDGVNNAGVMMKMKLMLPHVRCQSKDRTNNQLGVTYVLMTFVTSQGSDIWNPGFHHKLPEKC